MSQQDQGWSSSVSPAEPYVKQKRGRPRKDDGVVHGENMPITHGSDSVKRNEQCVGTSNSVADNMVGQVVSGVIEGSFDAGYLLNVKVADTDTHLRGVVFLPGRFTPITAANDVTPRAKMYKRKEIPIAFLNPQTKIHVSVPPLEQSIKQPVERKNNPPTFSDQVLGLKIQSGVTPENLSAPVMVPLADNFPKNVTGVFLGRNVMAQQSLESGVESQPPTAIAQFAVDKVVERDEVLLESEASSLTKGPNIDVRAAKELKSEMASKPSADMLPGIETINEELQIQHQALCCVLKRHQPLGPEIDETPVGVVPKFITSESGCEALDILMEENASPKKDMQQDTLSGRAVNILSADDTSHLNGGSVSDAAKNTETGSHSAVPMRSQPIPMFLQGEAIPFEPKLSAEGSILPGIIELNQTPIFDEPNSISSEQFSPKKDTPLDIRSVVAINILSGDDTPHLNGRPVSDAAIITEADSQSAPFTGEQILMYDGEAIYSEPKVAAEGSVLPGLVELQNFSSSGAVNNVDCGIKEAIPPKQS